MYHKKRLDCWISKSVLEDVPTPKLLPNKIPEAISQCREFVYIQEMRQMYANVRSPKKVSFTNEDYRC